MPLLLQRMLRPGLLASVFVVVAFAAACSGSPGGNNPRYPRRPPGCALDIYNGVPDIKVYDDIGVAARRATDARRGGARHREARGLAERKATRVHRRLRRAQTIPRGQCPVEAARGDGEARRLLR